MPHHEGRRRTGTGAALAPVVFFARDPGAANQVTALVLGLAAPDSLALSPALLEEMLCGPPGGPVVVHGKDAAAAIFASHGLCCLAGVPDLPALRPRALVTGTTDIDDRSDVELWQCARRLPVPSRALLDRDSNIALRFRDRSGAPVFPDLVYAPDAGCAAGAVQAGLPPDRIRHTGGDLHLRRLARMRGSAADARELRARAGIPPDVQAVLFASECGREMARAGRPAARDEIACLEHLLARLAQGAPPASATRPPLVLIRPHPRDLPGKYDAFLREHPFPVRLLGHLPAHEALLAADVVAGMESTLLAEAAVLGRPVFLLHLPGHVLPVSPFRSGS